MRDKQMRNMKPFRVRLLVAGVILALTASSLSPVISQTKKKRQPVYHTIYANQVMRVRLNEELDSETARIGDTFTSTLVDPLYAKNGVMLAPQGSIVNGRVINVTRAQKDGKPATLDVTFTSLRLPNGLPPTLIGVLIV